MNPSSPVLAYVLLTLAASALADESPAPSPPAETPYTATLSADGIQHVAITGGSYFFHPSHIIVKVNTPVELDVTLEQGIVPHTLVIRAPAAGMNVDEKLSTETKKISFTPTAVGEYAFYCRNRLLFFKSHRDKGMAGVLDVVE